MQLYESELRFRQIQTERCSIPAWTKAEHMEMSAPEKELWRYSGDVMCPSQNNEGTEVCFSL